MAQDEGDDGKTEAWTPSQRAALREQAKDLLRRPQDDGGVTEPLSRDRRAELRAAGAEQLAAASAQPAAPSPGFEADLETLVEPPQSAVEVQADAPGGMARTQLVDMSQELSDGTGPIKAIAVLAVIAGIVLALVVLFKRGG